MLHMDVINELVGKPLKIRSRRPITVAQVQKSYDALFLASEEQDFSLDERFAIATFVARLHGFDRAISFYDRELQKRQPQWSQIICKAADAAKSTGPFGFYPKGPLSKEDTIGKSWIAGHELKNSLGVKLACALTHAHLLVFHPRDCEKSNLDTLLQSGWNEKTLVTLSQLVAFLCFQIRLAEGLKVLTANQQDD